MTDIPKRIAVSGAKGFVGTATLNALSYMAEPPDLLMGIDIEPVTRPEGYGGEFLSVDDRDISEPMDDMLRDAGIDCFIHLAFQMPGRRDASTAYATNIRSAGATMESCAKSGVARYIYTSSTTIYGAHASFSKPYTEEDPPHPTAGFQYSEDKVEAERLIFDLSERNPKPSVCILRICIITGEGENNFIEPLLYTPFVPAHMGSNPPVQFLDIEDYKTLILKVISSNATGVFNIAGAGAVPWKEIAPLIGSRSLPLPFFLMDIGTEITWNLSLQKTLQSPGVNLIRWPWIVSTGKAERTFDWQPTRSARQVLESWAESKDKSRNIFDVLFSKK